jgi:phosphoserine aminotransferase
MAQINQQKAKLLYGLIDGSNDFYRPWGEAAFRSDMNVAFNLPTKDLEALFLNEATAAGFSGLAVTARLAACAPQSITR